ncbi:MAG: HlyD family efflux transporter periplasmic adaptor subunit [Candidatus Obscuribacterales bacterium]|nr:HlyD family efflux transporter periplasmic adaptor subunit [Candidatus Obscuribacterales bacterium]
MSNFSPAEQASQVAEQMQLAVFEKHGGIAQKGIYLLLVLMLLFIVWATFAESDVCAEAKGRLEPRSRVQLLRPTADGTIFEYRVSDGQAVKKGDVLIVLNTIRAEAELKKKEQELSILETQLKEHENARDGLARIIADPRYSGRESLAIPDADRIAGELFAAKQSLDSATYDVGGRNFISGRKMTPELDVLSAQKKKLESVKAARNRSVETKSLEREAEKKKLLSKVQALSSALEKAKTQLAELQASLADAQKEMAIYEKGRQLGVASEVKFLEVQNYMHQREFSVAQQNLQITELEQELNAAQVDLESSGRAFNADKADLIAGVEAESAKLSSVPLSVNETVRALESKQAAFEVASYHARARYSKELTEISAIQRKISEGQSAALVLSEQLSEKYIKAPVDGTVSDLQHLLPGEMVLRGQPLLTVVPLDQDLVLRAEVNNTDVGFVELGQSARLRVEAFPCEEFGIVEGKVIRVDDYPEEKTEGQKKVSVYKVTIKPRHSYLERGRTHFELKPGMQIEADIILRKRSLLALLFEPLLKMGNY